VAPIQSGPSYSGPRMVLDGQTTKRIIVFVQRFVAASQSDNGTTGMQVKTSVQLTVEKQGDQFMIVAIWPRVLERRAL
jgi:hypothetical protein